jgi:hypothetical protein
MLVIGLNSTSIWIARILLCAVVVPGLRMARLNRVGYGLTVATHVPAEHFPSRRGEVLTVRTPYGERVRTASALGRMRANSRAARMPIHPLRPRFFDPAAEKAGVAWTHAARTASHGGLAVAAGATVKAVQQMLDHASAAMTPRRLRRSLCGRSPRGCGPARPRAREIESDQMRTERRPSRSNQALLPLENPSAQAAG